VITFFLFSGCGDLEPELQDTRTVILKMDFNQKSSSRATNVSAADVSTYKTHFIMVQPSWENLSSNYVMYYSSLAEGLLDPVSRKITLEIPLNTQMKIFAFLIKENYSHYDLFSAKPEAGYYGESQSFSIGTTTDSLSLGIKLTQVSGTDTTVTTDTTAPVLTEVYPVTTPTSDSTPEYTFHSTKDGTISYGGSCSSTKTYAISGNNTITLNALSDGTYSDVNTGYCTITVTDSAGNVSNTLTIPTFTVATSYWELIARQVDNDSNFDKTFSTDNKSNFLENANDSSNSTFMSIGNLEKNNYADSGGNYKFKLVWGGLQIEENPPINKEVIWTQTSWLEDSTITDFEEISNSGYSTTDIDQRAHFRGLGASSSSRCFIDGNGSTAWWWNCVGANNTLTLDGVKGIPGPLQRIASSMKLYIWALGN